MKQFTTFPDVVKHRSSKISAADPIDATEYFIKYDQDWPVNKEKDEKDKPSPPKKQKSSGDAKENAKDALKQINPENTFDTEKYTAVPVLKRKELNDDTRIYTFRHPFKSADAFNLGIGQHILCGFVLKDGSIVERPYAITRPTGADKDDGTIDILVKTSFPNEKDPGGTVSNILDNLDPERADEMLIRGPEGPISYKGNGEFSISHEGGKPKPVSAKKVNFISGGTGMTPIYATIRAMLETDDSDQLKVKFIDANINKSEVLLHEELNNLHDKYDNFDITHVFEKPDDSWDGEKGLVDQEKMERHLFPAADDTISLVCGPPPMMKAAKEGLLELGFEDGKTFFHY